ncbi:hypothetical protein AB1Y20_019986 [Prymnesium parvum]|uniref:Uncharacterized protein n=1 Tax=Prymnesium parvum TaxID=97485 RepID=A0AB34JXG4_PRYPA
MPKDLCLTPAQVRLTLHQLNVSLRQVSIQPLEQRSSPFQLIVPDAPFGFMQIVVADDIRQGATLRLRYAVLSAFLRYFVCLQIAGQENGEMLSPSKRNWARNDDAWCDKYLRIGLLRD